MKAKMYFVFTCRTVQAIKVIVYVRLLVSQKTGRSFSPWQNCAAVIGSGYEHGEDKHMKDTFC